MPGGLTRKDAVALLQKLGHTYAASVTKNTHYLIWDGATAGQKLAQALRYRTTLLDAAQLPALQEWTELPGRTHSALLAKALRLMNTDDAGQRQLRIGDVSPPAAESCAGKRNIKINGMTTPDRAQPSGGSHAAPQS